MPYNKASYDVLKWQMKVGNLLTHYLVKGKPVVVAGGSATDSILGLECKDFDVFMSEEQFEQFDPLHFTRTIGGGNREPAEAETFSSEYGNNTLRYRINATVFGRPAVIEIISVKSDKYPRTDAYSDKRDFFSAAVYCVLQTFSTSTSWSFFECSDIPCVMTRAITSSGYMNTVNVVSGDTKMLSKVLQKYSKYLGNGLRDNVTPEGMVRQYGRYTVRSLVLTEYGFVESQFFPEVFSVKESEYSGDPKNPMDQAEQGLPSMWERDLMGSSSARPLPPNGVSTGGVAQELQPNRGQALRPAPPSEFGSLLERIASPFSENTRVTPPIPAPEPRDFF